ncbi:MAG TPA: hypothetical protein VJ550_01880 [Geomonas sp.]|nr:hypothetical protein [Geomonas sp.]
MTTRLGHSGMAMALLVTFLLVTGCAHQSPAPGAEMKIPDQTATIQGVQEDYDQAESQVESTEEALQELYVSPEADLQQAADSFRKNARMMLALGDPLVRHADGMHVQGPSYLVERKEVPPSCPVPGAAMLMAFRPAQLDGFEAIADLAWEVKRAYRAYQFDVQQVYAVLTQDVTPVKVTPAMVKGLELIVRKAGVDSENLKDAIEATEGAIDQATSAQAQAAPKNPPQAAAPGQGQPVSMARQ